MTFLEMGILAMSKLIKYEFNYTVDETKTEGTGKPVWFIVKTSKLYTVRKSELPYQIMGRIVGPFTSRESAEAHRQSRIYEYGKDSVVYCHSAYYSDLMEAP